MIAERLRRKDLANRKPLWTMGSGPGWLWDRNEVGEARKRVAAKAFIRRNSTMNPADLIHLSTQTLVTLAKTVKELNHANRN